MTLYSLWVRRYAPFESFGLGFEGDKRAGASADMSATARTIAGCSFGPGEVGPGTGSSSGSDHVLWPGDRRFAKVETSVSVQSKSLSTLRFILHSEGSNPLAPGAPDIDTFVHMSIVFSSTHISLGGDVYGDNFPNAEVFVYDAVGANYMLFEFATTGGQNTGPFTRLFGSHSDQLLGSFQKRIPIDNDKNFRVLVDAGPSRVPTASGGSG